MKNGKSDQNLALARRIRNAGVIIYIAEDDGGSTLSSVKSDGLLIRQVGGVTESPAFDFYGGTAFIIHLIITIDLPEFAISSFELECPWRPQVRWLEDPQQIDGESNVYRFGDKNSVQFDRSEVLNHLADVRRIISCGRSLKGCLLGIGDSPMPEDLRHGAEVPAFVNVVDQFGRRHRSAVLLWADRSERFRRQVPRTRSRKALFECPDKVST